MESIPGLHKRLKIRAQRGERFDNVLSRKEQIGPLATQEGVSFDNMLPWITLPKKHAFNFCWCGQTLEKKMADYIFNFARMPFLVKSFLYILY